MMAAAARADAPSYTVDGIVNASDYAHGPFSPNAIVSIFGSGLAWSARGVTSSDVQSGRMPTSLNGVQVFVADYPAPLFYVSESQINFLMPNNLWIGRVPIRVVRESVHGPDVYVDLVEASPALFDLPAAAGWAIAQRWPDYSLVAPDSPVKAGDIIMLYATGMGPAHPGPSRPDEIPTVPSPLDRLKDLKVFLNGEPIDQSYVLWAGVSPGSVGLYQVNLKVPGALPPNPEIRVAIGNQVSAPGLKLAYTDH